MKHLFVPYELALLAKEKGFNEECLGWWWKDNGGKLFLNTNNAFGADADRDMFLSNAPLYQQLVDWFRKKHIMIRPTGNSKHDGFYSVQRLLDTGREWISEHNSLDLALTEAFKLI